MYMYHKNFLFVLKTKVFVSCTCTVKLYRATHGTCVATCNVFRVHYILLLHTRTSTFIHSGRRDSRRSKKGQKGAERGGKGRKGAERGGRERGVMLYCTNVDFSVNLEVNINMATISSSSLGSIEVQRPR